MNDEIFEILGWDPELSVRDFTNKIIKKHLTNKENYGLIGHFESKYFELLLDACRELARKHYSAHNPAIGFSLKSDDFFNPSDEKEIIMHVVFDKCHKQYNYNCDDFIIAMSDFKNTIDLIIAEDFI